MFVYTATGRDHFLFFLNEILVILDVLQKVEINVEHGNTHFRSLHFQ